MGTKHDIYGIHDLDDYIEGVETMKGFYGQNFKYFQTYGGGPEGGFIMICGKLEKGRIYEVNDMIIYEVSRGWGEHFTVGKWYQNHSIKIYGETDFSQGRIVIKRKYKTKCTI